MFSYDFTAAMLVFPDKKNSLYCEMSSFLVMEMLLFKLTTGFFCCFFCCCYFHLLQ